MQTLYNLDSLTDLYDGFLFDAYGVLYDGKGLIESCVASWRKLQSRGKPCYVVSNGSSRTLDESVNMYRRLGLILKPSEIINSASLLKGFYADQGLMGSHTAVLGTKSSALYVEEAGGIVVNPLATDDYSIVVLANQSDYPLLDTLEAVLSQVITRIENSQPIRLILTNPDLIYPHQFRRFGITAGSFAGLLEAALGARLGKDAPHFEKLGKPFPPIFHEAIRRVGSKNLLMVGDQLETDIRGANNSGLDSVLVGTGMIRVDVWSQAPNDPIPTYILPEWRVT